MGGLKIDAVVLSRFGTETYGTVPYSDRAAQRGRHVTSPQAPRGLLTSFRGLTTERHVARQQALRACVRALDELLCSGDRKRGLSSPPTRFGRRSREFLLDRC